MKHDLPPLIDYAVPKLEVWRIGRYSASLTGVSAPRTYSFGESGTDRLAMAPRIGEARRVSARGAYATAGVTAVALVLAAAVAAAVALTQVSSDPYSSPTPGQHHAEVEPDTFAAGSTVVSAFQTGRFFDGGATDVGFATSTDSGATWTHGPLPGITKAEGGAFDRATDPSVAYDAKHGVWLIDTLTLNGTQPQEVVAIRSTDGGHTWGNVSVVGGGVAPDKNWIVCDDTAASPFYGHCYAEWDDNGRGNLIQMSTSTDGGLTWGPARSTADSATGIGGQPLVRSDGQVVVPIDNAFEGSVLYFTSADGGATWSATHLVANISDHTVAAGIRTEPLPSAEIDKKNKVYIVWQDCRFRTSCAANDVVMARITNRFRTSKVVRIPIDAPTSGIDHFTPAIAVDRTTAGKTAHLGIAYYFFPVANCGSSCALHVGYVSSTDGGSTWSAASDLAGPMDPVWLANTNQGRMFGDYISASFAGGTVHPVFAVANAPNGSVFDEAMYTATGGLPAAGGKASAVMGPIRSTKSDHPALSTLATSH